MAVGPHSSPRAVGELVGAIGTGVTFIVHEPLGVSRVAFFAACASGWAAYLGHRLVREPGAAGRLGLRRDNLAAAMRQALPILVAGIVTLAGWRAAVGWRPLPSGTPWLLLLYPFWALVQQTLVQGCVAANLARVGFPHAAVLPLAAGCFALVHAPDWPLVGLTGTAGLVWTACFLHIPNVLPLALCHGWLGALAYGWVLERDPLAALAAGG